MFVVRLLIVRPSSAACSMEPPETSYPRGRIECSSTVLYWIGCGRRDDAAQPGVDDMTERLQHALERVQQLPDEEQDHLASLIEEELDELEWDALLQKPGARAFLKELVEEGRAEHAAGATEEIGDTLG